jgi:hypothetical protein
VVPGSRGGFGWAQWTGRRRRAFEQYARENGPESDLLRSQLRLYPGKELRITPKRMRFANSRRTKNASEAAIVFMDEFERPGVLATDKRVAYAQQALAASKDAPRQTTGASGPGAGAAAGGSAGGGGNTRDRGGECGRNRLSACVGEASSDTGQHTASRKGWKPGGRGGKRERRRKRE